eukprot:CAMPEP_0194414218 /NCGR_PEP_ID=MMETSP0176-20130528/12816_1 /TAXON_ID=216777 /ORGANISM="Proboscia alata, Strain PI-D3" /LENGTH=565 /DNA_ID=CAMNT_0039218037 /DNA_START=296 /DNA_END=1993 /DNA_ORIENTATION=-
MSYSDDEGNINLGIFSDDDDDSNVEGSLATWRLDPKESFSDFVIVVAVEEEEKIDDDTRRSQQQKQPSSKEYFVHKERLMVGPRKSKVLLKAIQSNMAEAATNRYKTALKQTAADAFPIMLDYIYTGNLSLNEQNDRDYFTDPTSENTTHPGYVHCVALRFLSSYFEIKTLHVEVNNYILGCSFPYTYTYHDEGNEDTWIALAHVWEESMIYNDEKIMDVLRKKTLGLAMNKSMFVDYSSLSSFLIHMPIEFIRHVWEHPSFNQMSKYNEEHDQTSRIELLTQVLADNHHNINGEVLLQVTHQLSALEPKLYSSVLSHKAAKNLLQVASKLDRNNPTTQGIENQCVKAVANSWENAFEVKYAKQEGTSKRQRIEALCQDLSITGTNKLLVAVVSKASDDITYERKENRNWVNQYLDYTQSLGNQQVGFQHPTDGTLFIFGGSAYGSYRLYAGKEMKHDGRRRIYVMQNPFRYTDYGDTNFRAYFEVKYNQPERKWRISVRYTKDKFEGKQFEKDKIERIDKVLYEVEATQDSDDVPKTGWKNIGDDRWKDDGDILVQHYEAICQA